MSSELNILDVPDLIRIDADEVKKRFGHIVQAHYRTQNPVPRTIEEKTGVLKRALGEGWGELFETDSDERAELRCLEYTFILRHFI